MKYLKYQGVGGEISKAAEIRRRRELTTTIMMTDSHQMKNVYV